MLDLGTLRLGIKVDSDSAKSELNKVGGEVQGTGSKVAGLADKAKTMIKAFAAAYAVKELVKLGKAAMEQYSKFEQLEGGVEKIFGEKASKDVMKYAERAYKTAGMSANQYMEQVTSFSASLIQSLDGDTVKAAKVADMAIQDMSDNANVFGTDMTSIQNAYQGFAKQNYTMLDNLKLGYGGTKEEMQRLLSDAEKLSGQKYDISNLNDVYEAIHVVQEEMHITGTTSREAATTIEGSTNMMKASWQNLLTNMGRGKGVDKAMDEFIKSVAQVAKNMAPVALNIAKSLVQAFAKSFPKLLGMIGTAMTNLSKGITSEGGKKLATSAIKLAKSLAEGLVQNVPILIEGAGRLIIALVQALIAAAGQLVKAGAEAMKQFVQGFMNANPQIANAVRVLGRVFDTVLTPVKKLIDLVTAAWKTLMGQKAKKDFQVNAPFSGAIAMIKDVFNRWKDVLAQKASKAISVVQSGISSAISSIKDVYNRWKDVLGQKASKTYSVVKSGFDSVLSSMKSIYNKWKDILSQASTKTFTTYNNTVNSTSSSGKKSSKKKKRIGLSEVPYDGYEAELHKGETILTAAETNQYRKYLDTLGNTASGIVNGINASSLMAGSGVTEARIIINLGGAKVAEQIYKLNKQGRLAFEG